MRLLIQVSSRPGCGAAQPAITALKAVLTVTVKSPVKATSGRFTPALALKEPLIEVPANCEFTIRAASVN